MSVVPERDDTERASLGQRRDLSRSVDADRLSAGVGPGRTMDGAGFRSCSSNVAATRPTRKQLERDGACVMPPRIIAEDGATHPMSKTESNDLPASRRILVIDDDHDVADSLVMFLETFGADVRVAYDGEGGVAAVREFQPELIFLDLGMPKLDGYETARRIRALPEGRDVKLFALSGWGQGQIGDRARDAGFDRQLTKPAGIEELQELLNAV